MSLPERIFSTLAGSWKLTRTISGEGTVEGTAQFTPQADASLHYREDGLFTADDGTTYTIFREYCYRLKDGEISVFFAKTPERLFHILSFTGGSTATASHLCEEDCYDSEYSFSDPDTFSLIHTVKGPRKDYCISTLFRRLV